MRIAVGGLQENAHQTAALTRRDTGAIKQGLLRAVPNRLFEPALTALADLDRALGDYVRGLFLECCLLGTATTSRHVSVSCAYH